MGLLSKLFGGTTTPDVPVGEDYKEYRITPQPVKEGPNYRVGALIEKEVAGQMLSHTLIRADTLQSLEAAQEASVNKAKMMIDEQGERLFG